MSAMDPGGHLFHPRAWVKEAQVPKPIPCTPTILPSLGLQAAPWPSLQPCLSVDSFQKQCLNMLQSLFGPKSSSYHHGSSFSSMPKLHGSCVISHLLWEACPWPALCALYTQSSLPGLASWAPAKCPLSELLLATLQWQSHCDIMQQTNTLYTLNSWRCSQTVLG